MKTLALAVTFLWCSSCMTATVIHDARHPGPKNQVAWGNYLFLPLTIPADIATSPMQIPVFIAYAIHGDRPHHAIVPIKKSGRATNEVSLDVGGP
jgi:hypothetical protein